MNVHIYRFAGSNPAQDVFLCIVTIWFLMGPQFCSRFLIIKEFDIFITMVVLILNFYTLHIISAK